MYTLTPSKNAIVRQPRLEKLIMNSELMSENMLNAEKKVRNRESPVNIAMQVKGGNITALLI